VILSEVGAFWPFFRELVATFERLDDFVDLDFAEGVPVVPVVVGLAAAAGLPDEVFFEVPWWELGFFLAVVCDAPAAFAHTPSPVARSSIRTKCVARLSRIAFRD